MKEFLPRYFIPKAEIKEASKEAHWSKYINGGEEYLSTKEYYASLEKFNDLIDSQIVEIGRLNGIIHSYNQRLEIYETALKEIAKDDKLVTKRDIDLMRNLARNALGEIGR